MEQRKYHHKCKSCLGWVSWAELCQRKRISSRFSLCRFMIWSLKIWHKIWACGKLSQAPENKQIPVAQEGLETSRLGGGRATCRLEMFPREPQRDCCSPLFSPLGMTNPFGFSGSRELHHCIGSSLGEGRNLFLKERLLCILLHWLLFLWK